MGPDDYLEICRNFDVVIIENIPELDALLINETRRLITFIDTAYEMKIKIIATAEKDINHLFKSAVSSTTTCVPEMTKKEDKLSPVVISEESFASSRTISRLTEMQTVKVC